MASSHEYVEEYSHDVVKLFDTCVYEATIVTVNKEEDTATITIPEIGTVNEVPIFYHCPGSDVVEGGSTAFKDGDSVLVLCKGCKDSGIPGDMMKIVGFTDGLRACDYYFYIRPTFNGFDPVVCQETIKLKNETTSEQKATIAVGDFAKLCGPFSNQVDTGDEAIYLSSSGGNGHLFAYYHEVPVGDAAIHIGITFPNYNLQMTQFIVGADNPILHVNHVEWLWYGTSLSDCPKSSIVVGGVTYPVYNVDFTGLSLLKQVLNENYLEMITGCNYGCGFQENESPSETVLEGLLSIKSVSIIGHNSSGILGCDGNLPGWPKRYEQYEYHFNGTEEFAVNKEQILILSGEHGQNSTYQKLEFVTYAYLVSHKIWEYDPSVGTTVECEITNHLHSGWSKYTYTKSLTPQDRF